MFNSVALWWQAAVIVQHRHPLASISFVMMFAAKKDPHINVPIPPSPSPITALGHSSQLTQTVVFFLNHNQSRNSDVTPLLQHS